jgi:hypothetical protein
MPNLTAFGATEYMDGALTYPVLNELFLRGGPSGGRGRPSRGRSFFDLSDAEEEDRERRRECKDIEAVDFTGCVSAVFVNAFNEFVSTHLIAPEHESSSEDEMDGRRTRRIRFVDEPLTFLGLKRLGMRGVKSILPRFLGPFILAFPSLSHLDLSGTRITSEILNSLGASNSIRLQSLALARCVKLCSESIRNFLIASPVAAELQELNLYGDMTYLSPLTQEHLLDIVSGAPCFVSGELRYLDISGAPVDKEVLKTFRPQSSLRSLGLSHLPSLSLKDIQKFMIDKTPNVEVLTLINTAPELDFGLRANSTPRNAVINLHTHLIRPLSSPPFSFSISSPNTQLPPPTRLRVVELSTGMLGALGAGAGAWRIIRSKGGRGWYVDTASTWVAVLKRDLPSDHPYRVEMERLSDANGNVSSGIGWHARKMEVSQRFTWLLYL